MDLLSAIQGVGDTIDKTTGGRAVRGLLAGKPRELLSPIPFSDTMGLTDSKDSTSGRDLTDAYGLTHKGDNSFGSHAAGFLADTVLSPGNLIGGYGAFKAAPTLAKGITAGAKAATGLDLLDHVSGAAKSAKGITGNMFGPMYAGGTRKLSDAADSTASHYLSKMGIADGTDIPEYAKMMYSKPVERLNDIAASKYGNRIASEIPDGSQYLGHGNEAMVLKTPTGSVVRISDQPFTNSPNLGIPEVIQPYRASRIGPYSVEHLPMVTPLDMKSSGSSDIVEAMKNSLESQGYNPWDLHGHNMGITKEGKYVIHDPGSVSGPRRATGLVSAVRSAASSAAGRAFPDLARRSLESAIANGSMSQGVAPGDLLSAIQSVLSGRGG